VPDVVTISIVTTVNGLGNPPITNSASLTSNAGPTNILSNDSDSVTITIRTPNLAVAALPATGFAPNMETKVLPQPKSLAYAATDLLLEIPSLGVKIPIVGVPKKNGAWDVSWLGKQAGWLDGTAFPSWSGNSVLTSHVYLANGLPGPFVNLGKLKYGDKIIIHAYGQKYTFEVRTNQTVAPNDTSALKHEVKPWLTLVTCKEYDEKTNTYKKRVIVRAVLVSVDWDK
jgi:LPXTG-site transpeptidase (sortase) family protein